VPLVSAGVKADTRGGIQSSSSVTSDDVSRMVRFAGFESSGMT
jgi:hypothetical protein